jgi:predicted molibdopterin-dependent oxidoreductase YjgC
MKEDSMLRRLPTESPDSNTKKPPITLHWYDQTITAQNHDTVASALLFAGVRVSRNSALSGEARLPFCMMGSCFECLVDIDGKIVQSCMTQVKNGMLLKMPEQI